MNLASKTKKILFTGDSITEAGRNSLVSNDLGFGFVSNFSHMLLSRHPERTFEVINTGIGGNTVSHLLTRVHDDVIEHEADIILILIGINDAVRIMDGASSLCLEPQEFGLAYAELVQEIRANQPLSEIVLMSPFFLSRGNYQANSYRLRLIDMVKKYEMEVEKVAENFETLFIRLSDYFYKIIDYKPSSILSGDRIHPNGAGHMVIADAIYECLRNKL